MGYLLVGWKTLETVHTEKRVGEWVKGGRKGQEQWNKKNPKNPQRESRAENTTLLRQRMRAASVCANRQRGRKSEIIKNRESEGKKKNRKLQRKSE